MNQRVELLWAPADGYLQAIQQLAAKKQHENSGPLSAPIFLLIGFNLELMLKAFHAHNGATDDDLKDLGHDLDASLKKAKDAGWKSATEVESLISMMSPLHKSHTFRYLKLADVEVPDVDKACAILDAWGDEMHAVLFPS